MTDRIHDVVVLGGGNAGLSAALTARELGARVAVIEAAPRAFSLAATARGMNGSRTMRRPLSFPASTRPKSSGATCIA